MKNKQTGYQKLQNSLSIVFSAALIITGILIFTYLWKFGTTLTSDHERWAEFGNFFGGTLGPIISFFAFFALLITINLQNKAINTSKNELELSREELKKTSESSRIQANHFINEANINDIISSIRMLEDQIKDLMEDEIVVHSVTGEDCHALKCFLGKGIVSIADCEPASENTLSLHRTITVNERVKSVASLLFDQIVLLGKLNSTQNRYRVLISKHLEDFLILDELGIFKDNWKSELSEKYLGELYFFEELLRIAKISHGSS